MDFAANIKGLREQRGLLRKHLARELGITYTVYCWLETRKRDPLLAELRKLAKFYDTTVEELVNPRDVISEKALVEEDDSIKKMKLILELDEEDREIIFRLMDKMLNNKRVK